MKSGTKSSPGSVNDSGTLKTAVPGVAIDLPAPLALNTAGLSLCCNPLTLTRPARVVVKECSDQTSTI